MKDTLNTWVAVIRYSRETKAGQYLAGPKTPKEVKARGYGFTNDPKKAWPFPSEKQAKAKARVVDRHMGWGEGVMDAEPAVNVRVGPYLMVSDPSLSSFERHTVQVVDLNTGKFSEVDTPLHDGMG